MLKELDTYKGYTVDFRLREFRKMIYGQMPVFIPFKSPKGGKLLKDYITRGGKDELDMR